MRIARARLVPALAAVALLAAAATPAAAQPPTGSYLRSCREARVEGGALLALCRRTDGGWQRTALADIGGCRGDIANRDGRLSCRRARHSHRSRYDAAAERRTLCHSIEHALTVTRERLRGMPAGERHQRYERRLAELHAEQHHSCGR